jgi:hypothetical protein
MALISRETVLSDAARVAFPDAIDQVHARGAQSSVRACCCARAPLSCDPVPVPLAARFLALATHRASPVRRALVDLLKGETRCRPPFDAYEVFEGPLVLFDCSNGSRGIGRPRASRRAR